MIGPFQLRAGVPQLFVAGFEEGGEVGVLSGIQLVLREGDVFWRCNLPFCKK